MSDEWQAYLKDTRRICKYGINCYQKNSEHQSKFKHPPQQFKGKASNDKRNNTRYSPYSRNDKGKNQDKVEKEKNEACSSSEISEVNTSTMQGAVENKECVEDDVKFTKIALDENTQYFDKDSDNNIYKDCFLVEMPPDFFQFCEFLKSEEDSIGQLLSKVNLQLIGPFDLLFGKLPVIDDKDLYLVHWRFYYDPPEFQAVLKKSGKSEYHIGYFRDNPTEEPVFLAENDSKKDYAIKPIAKNIFGAVYWYLQNEKKSSPFVTQTCQKLMEKIKKWAEKCNYTLEVFNMKSRQAHTVCKSFHGAGIAVPYEKKTELGYRSLAESDAKIRKLFKQFADATTENEKDKVLSDLQPVITYGTIAVDEGDFGTGLEAGIALFCSGQKELGSRGSALLSAVYPLLNRDAFSKIIQVHMKYRRKGADLSIMCK